MYIILDSGFFKLISWWFLFVFFFLLLLLSGFFFFNSFCYRTSKDLRRSKEDKKEETEVGMKQELKKRGEN
jgi:CBS domain containing-hemolysin-like protein